MLTDSLSQSFGVTVRQRRIEAGLSQESLAERAELHPTYISMIERGIRNPTLDVVERIAAGLAVDLVVLIKEAQICRATTQGKCFQ